MKSRGGLWEISNVKNETEKALEEITFATEEELDSSEITWEVNRVYVIWEVRKNVEL